MPVSDLATWVDGDLAAIHEQVPVRIEEDNADRYPVQLWVLRPKDLVYAREFCPFGDARPSGKIKHTNLTGGADAHSGGELRFLGGNTVAVNGASGRYGPQSEAELEEIVQAFHASGYRVFWTGYDPDTNTPNPLVGVDLRLAA